MGDANASIGRAQQQSAAESPAWRRSVDGEAAEAECGRVVTAELRGITAELR
jgi:hypothetical protein